MFGLEGNDVDLFDFLKTCEQEKVYEEEEATTLATEERGVEEESEEKALVVDVSLLDNLFLLSGENNNNNESASRDDASLMSPHPTTTARRTPKTSSPTSKPQTKKRERGGRRASSLSNEDSSLEANNTINRVVVESIQEENEDDEDEEEAKKRRRLEKNRASAQLSRERKRDQLEKLEQQVKELQQDNCSLAYTLSVYHAELQRLTAKLEEKESSEQKHVQVQQPVRVQQPTNPQLCGISAEDKPAELKSIMPSILPLVAISTLLQLVSLCIGAQLCKRTADAMDRVRERCHNRNGQQSPPAISSAAPDAASKAHCTDGSAAVSSIDAAAVCG